MKKFASSIVGLTLIGIFIVMSCNNQNENKPTLGGTNISRDSMIKHGEYLVTIMGCDDCHTPKKFGPQGPEPDMDRRFSGHPSNMAIAKVNKEELKSWVLFSQDLTAFVGPWGVSYAANLTSDDSGIGTWTEQQFIKALREGKLKGLDNSRPILPPMPWPAFSKATDEDLKSIYAFLKSTKPIENVVPAPVAPDQISYK
jgi:hypothetical protein